MIPRSHMLLLSTWNVARVAEKLNFTFYFSLINLNLNVKANDLLQLLGTLEQRWHVNLVCILLNLNIDQVFLMII